ncbi:unnamed protein product [Cuscuta campestris]|uniref:Uncharacterized protein n=1 Tax=Cuscuta campestris TaxID=132261 RepID=A0A484L5A2_9ASTE|nr:unnamed protein product [Cuscuta campestris]
MPRRPPPSVSLKAFDFKTVDAAPGWHPAATSGTATRWGQSKAKGRDATGRQGVLVLTKVYVEPLLNFFISRVTVEINRQEVET